MQIEINKQPLFGTVYWSGVDFVYSPNLGFSGNDFYIYTKTENGKTSTHTNYVNPTNVTPVALNPILSADAHGTNVYSVEDLISDSTLPFGALTISNLSNALHGSARTDGSKIYYNSNGYNSADFITFDVSDKQFTINATLTLTIDNGLTPQNPYGNPSDRLDALSSSMTFFNYHSGNWESTYNTVSSNSAVWNALDANRYIRMANEVESISAGMNSLVSNKGNYDSVLTTVSAHSADWSSVYNYIDGVSSLIYSNSANWDGTFQTVTIYKNIWNGLSSNIDDLSAKMLVLNAELSSTVSTLTQSAYWDSLTINNILTTNALNWNSVYDFLILNYKEDQWNNTYTATQQFSTFFVDSKNKFDSANYTVASNDALWKNQSVYSILSAHSAFWDAAYSSINSLSGNWTQLSYDNFFNAVSSSSGAWSSMYSTVSSSSASWVSGDILLSGVSASFLTGGPTVNLSAHDLTVYGNAYIKGNLSAFGPKVIFNTDIYTASGFQITNNGTSDALIVDKVGFNAVANFKKNQNSILYVGSDFKSGINTSTPNTDLTVYGNISATGYVYPLYFEPINTFSANSAKYEGVYSYTNSNSATINAMVNSKVAYDNASLFVTNSSTKIDESISNKPILDSLYSTVCSQSAKNNNTNNLIAISGYNIDKDPYYRLSASNYDFFTSFVQSTSAADLTGYQLSHVFSNNKVITNQSAYIIVQDNVKIKSWNIYSKTPTNAIIDVLSGTFDSYPTMVSLVGNNYPALDVFFHPEKNYNNNLNSHWTTNVAKGSILQFNLTNNTASSAVLITLSVDKT